MTYRTKISNPNFSLKFNLLQAAVQKLGGRLDSPSGDNFIWRLSIDQKCIVFFAQTFPLNTASAWRLAQDKLATYQVLETFGVRVPKGIALFRPELGSAATHVEHSRLIENLREQLRNIFADDFLKSDALFVVKPGEECGGVGVQVCVGIDEVLSYAPEVFQWGHYGLVQEFVPGSEWRVFVLKGTAVLTYQRQSLTIQGDGRRTIREILSEDASLSDPVAQKKAILITNSGLKLDTVLRTDEKLALELGAQNLSQGARPIVVEDPPPCVIKTALRASELLGLGFSGVDLRLPPDGSPVVL
jgi:D-alanine-D-alanine ligase-like ATP-grasp enzyme